MFIFERRDYFAESIPHFGISILQFPVLLLSRYLRGSVIIHLLSTCILSSEGRKFICRHLEKVRISLNHNLKWPFVIKIACIVVCLRKARSCELSEMIHSQGR